MSRHSSFVMLGYTGVGASYHHGPPTKLSIAKGSLCAVRVIGVSVTWPSGMQSFARDEWWAAR